MDQETFRNSKHCKYIIIIWYVFYNNNEKYNISYFGKSEVIINDLIKYDSFNYKNLKDRFFFVSFLLSKLAFVLNGFFLVNFLYIL